MCWICGLELYLFFTNFFFLVESWDFSLKKVVLGWICGLRFELTLVGFSLIESRDLTRRNPFTVQSADFDFNFDLHDPNCFGLN